MEKPDLKVSIGGAKTADTGTEPLFLRTDYVRQRGRLDDPSVDDRASLAPQWDVYERASRFPHGRVIDVGCGGAGKSKRFFTERDVVLVDHPAMLAAIRWRAPRRVPVDLSTWVPDRELCRPDTLIVCADVIEHLWNPHVLLRALKSLMVDGCVLAISTPDRIAMNKALRRGSKGPPSDPRHVQEWSIPEFKQLLAYAGFEGSEVLRVPSRQGARDRIAQLWIFEA